MLTALAVVSFVFANAQDSGTSEGFANGDIFISGSFGYDSSSTGDAKDNTFEVSPRVGYFVAENIAIGARLGYTTRSQENGAGGEVDTNTFNVGGFGRYYFTPASKFSIFGEFGLDYFSSKVDVGAGDATTDGFGVGVGPGVSYFLGSNFAIEAFWGALAYASSNPEQGESTDNFSIGLDLNDINLGLVYKF